MGRGRPGVVSGRRGPGQGGRSHGDAGRGGGRGKRAAARMLKGRPQPTLPHTLNKELGIEGVDDDVDDGINIIGGGPLEVDADNASDDPDSLRDADAGPGEYHPTYFSFDLFLLPLGELRWNHTPTFTRRAVVHKGCLLNVA